MAPQSRPSLAGQLDKDIYIILEKVMSERPTNSLLRSSEVYDYIKSSNSSLARRPKKILMESIERAFQVLRSESDDDKMIDDEMIPEESADTNTMNRLITSQWSKSLKRESDTQNGLSVDSEAAPGAKAESVTATTRSKKRLANGEPPRKRLREISHTPPTGTSMLDLGGVEDVAEQLVELLALPLCYPEVFHLNKMRPPRGVLIHGPSGCGKTTIAKTFATHVGVSFINIDASSIVSGISGESEQILREYFEEAKRVAPCLMLIDKIDTISRKIDDTQRDMERRIVTQLITCMEDIARHNTTGKPVCVIATTNRPDSLDPSLRGGQFSREISIGIPKEPAREKILRALTKNLKLADDIDFAKLAQQTPGFVGADLEELVGTAANESRMTLLDSLADEGKQSETGVNDPSIHPKLTRFLNVFAGLSLPRTQDVVIKISNADFFKALPKIQPAIKREGFATVPNTTWEDVGALEETRKALKIAITEPILNPLKYEKAGITAASGVLLWGPPGCGKTLLAKAVANECRANFISIKGPELLNKFVGESERAIRSVFSRARASAPCLIFFDEIDALAATRDDGIGGSSVRVVNTLLTELDGLESREGVYVIAATNRPDTIDPALLRPGRLEKILFVGLPEEHERAAILRTIIQGMKNIEVSNFVSNIESAKTIQGIKFNETIQRVAKKCIGFSGADLKSLVRQAGEYAIERDDYIKLEDFVSAAENIRPSVTDIEKYKLKMAL